MKFKLNEEAIAMRVAKEIPPGSVVNLGLGLPSLVTNFVEEDRNVMLQAEVGLLNYGEIVTEPTDSDWDFVDAGGHPIRIKAGTSIFDSVAAHSMIRGGHIDIAILGGLQVSENGDLANWWRREIGLPNIGGAMDVASGACKVFVAMEHNTRDGKYKIVNKCSLPLTARRCVSKIFTDIAVIDITPEGLVLREVVPGWSPDDVQALTEPRLICKEEPAIMEL